MPFLSFSLLTPLYTQVGPILKFNFNFNSMITSGSAKRNNLYGYPFGHLISALQLQLQFYSCVALHLTSTPLTNISPTFLFIFYYKSSIISFGFIFQIILSFILHQIYHFRLFTSLLMNFSFSQF